MGVTRARFVRFVALDEDEAELVHDAKSLTYEHMCEHAVLELEDGRRVLVGGGQFGIELDLGVPDDSFGRRASALYVDVEGRAEVVARLVLHTHPKPTGGPSDDDLGILERLGQDESMLYELFGPPEGTVIRPKGRRG